MALERYWELRRGDPREIRLGKFIVRFVLDRRMWKSSELAELSRIPWAGIAIFRHLTQVLAPAPRCPLSARFKLHLDAK